MYLCIIYLYILCMYYPFIHLSRDLHFLSIYTTLKYHLLMLEGNERGNSRMKALLPNFQSSSS